MSTISSWHKIPNIGFDRAKSSLQNPLSHQAVESVLRDFLGTDFEHPHFARGYQCDAGKIFPI
jgi:hypothetical protein